MSSCQPYSFDAMGFQSHQSDYERFQSEFPEVVRTKVSKAMDDALFGPNSAIKAQLATIDERPTRDEVEIMISKAIAKLPTADTIEQIVMKAFAAFPTPAQSALLMSSFPKPAQAAQISQIVANTVPSKSEVQVIVQGEMDRKEDVRLKKLRITLTCIAIGVGVLGSIVGWLVAKAFGS